jgi:hypothetical protein
LLQVPKQKRMAHLICVTGPINKLTATATQLLLPATLPLALVLPAHIMAAAAIQKVMVVHTKALTLVQGPATKVGVTLILTLITHTEDTNLHFNFRLIKSASSFDKLSA